ncbi:MAG: right-handed parallel beta-helix repeat-containing protein [Candidatus Hydrogenedentes bacterium]|nr:right-handed parallel beta-helix repeat-containing protein [Candidatus Hydrogenedentota bacterium]
MSIARIGRLLSIAAACMLIIGPLCAAEPALEDLKAFADGKRPATAALQKLIDESDGAVTFPAGTFLIDAPLRVDLTVLGFRSLRGAEGTTRLLADLSGPAIQIVGSHNGTAAPESVEEHIWDKERFPVISGLEIVGKQEQADGIELVRTMKCTIRNVLIRRCRYGIHLVERNRNIIISDSHIYDGTDTGIFLDNCNLHQMNITGNHISYNKRAGIRQFNGDVHNVQIAGNDIEYNFGSEETSGEIVLESPDSLISEYAITGNTIQARPENPGANIYLAGSEQNAPGASRVIAITGNIIGDRDKNIVLTRTSKTTIAGNTIYGGNTLSLHFQQCANIVLNGNNIGTRPSAHAQRDSYTDGILLENCADCLITDNIVSEHHQGDATSGGAITLVDSRHCRVSDCQILRPKFRGVHLIGGVGCVVSDNSITAPDSGEFVAAIAVSGKGRAHMVQNNWIATTLSIPVVIDEGTCTLRENTTVAP